MKLSTDNIANAGANTVNDGPILLTTDNNNNDNKNESNIETMILTHVPKITIIHKIMKPLNNGRRNHFNHQNTNDNGVNHNDNIGINDQSNESGQNETNEKGNESKENGNEDLYDESDLYKEALRKHQDLIRSTMSSMSLYPAAFKRYKINSNNKINNVGEIYLLPNFFQANTDANNPNTSVLATAASSSSSSRAATLTEPTMMIQPIVRQHLSPEENLTLEWNPLTQTFVNIFNGHLENSLLNDKENQLMEHLFNNQNENIDNNHSNQLNSPNIFELELNSLNDNVNRRRLAKPKLLLNHHTILSVNQNPENILKLYRPRFKHRKRFRKVRIPAAVTLKKVRTLGPDFGKQDYVHHETNNVDTNQLLPNNNNRPTGSIVIKKPITTTTIAPTTTQPPPTTTTIPLTVDKTAKRKPGKYRNILLNNLQINNENNDKDDSGSNWDKNSTAISTDIDSNIELNTKVNLNQSNIPLTNGSEFKIFCTFDALRSMPLTAGAEDEIRYFNMEALEQNSAILKYCTHLVYAFANVDLNGDLYVGLSSIHQDLNLRSKNKELSEANLARLQRIKQQYPHLKVLLAVGGWDTPPQLFSLMVATDKLRDRLAINIQKFILEYGFNGAIIAWFYPVYGTRSTLDFRSIRAAGQTLFQVDDKENLFRFVRSLKTRFLSFNNGGNNNGLNGLEIGLMIPPFEEFIDRGYDAQKLSQ